MHSTVYSSVTSASEALPSTQDKRPFTLRNYHGADSINQRIKDLERKKQILSLQHEQLQRNILEPKRKALKQMDPDL